MRGQRRGTAGEVLALHVSDLGLILSIPMVCPLSPKEKLFICSNNFISSTIKNIMPGIRLNIIEYMVMSLIP